MRTVYIVDIEAVDSRYTKQWKEYLPQQLKSALGKTKVKVISGGETPQATTPGAFLNFGGTNVYKSKQLEQIGKLFCKGKVRDGDYFLYTDAWNPTVIQLRYMAELLGVDIRIGGMWHAGSYDPADFLGRLIGSKPWVRNAEVSMFHTYDDNFFATEFHIDMFVKTLFSELNVEAFKEKHQGKIHCVGWPMEYMKNTLAPYNGADKEDIILFPHRIAPEKQPEIFDDLAAELPDYKFIMCQKQQLTKDEYHKLLAKSKMVFSANLQETLGISWYEGALVGAIPMVPDRLSYSEMAISSYLYPSKMSSNFDDYISNKRLMIAKIKDVMSNYEAYAQKLPLALEKLDGFFDGSKLYSVIEGDTDA